MICMYAIIILRVRAGSLLGHRVDDQVLVPICCGGAHLSIDFLLIICIYLGGAELIDTTVVCLVSLC